MNSDAVTVTELRLRVHSEIGSSRVDPGMPWADLWRSEIEPGRRSSYQLVFGNLTRIRSGQTLHARCSRTEQLTNRMLSKIKMSSAIM